MSKLELINPYQIIEYLKTENARLEAENKELKSKQEESSDANMADSGS